MAVHRCPQCSFLNTDDEIEQGVCSACQAPLAPASAPPAREVAAPPPAGSPGRSRAVPFLLGLLLGGLIVAAGLWAALALGARLPGGPGGWTAASQDVQAGTTQAEDKAREPEAGRQAAESARADEAKALDAANQKLSAAQKQKDDAEQRARDALARLAEEQSRRAAAEKALAEERKPKLTPVLSFVRDWQLLGPFPTARDEGHDAVFPPEREPVQLGKAYDGPRGLVKWRPYESSEDKIDLSDFFQTMDPGVAYAVSWVHAEKDQDVTLSIGSDDGVIVWVNREKVHDFKGARPATPGQDYTKAHLREGWNEILAKVDNLGSFWALYLEFRTADGDRPLKVYSTSTPPPAPGK